jgi:membrane-bound acyltransferase YfiQ involved in biofilm formation
MLLMAVIYRYFNNDGKIWLSLIIMFITGVCFALGLTMRSNHSGLKIVGKHINSEGLKSELDEDKI